MTVLVTDRFVLPLSSESRIPLRGIAHAKEILVIVRKQKMILNVFLNKVSRSFSLMQILSVYFLSMSRLVKVDRLDITYIPLFRVWERFDGKTITNISL